MRFAVGRDQTVVRSVVLLSYHVCPSAIAWGITFSVVNSIYAQSSAISVGICPFSKRFKPVFAKPFIANSDALATIMLKQAIIFVVAPVLHIGICSVEWSSKRSML